MQTQLMRTTNNPLELYCVSVFSVVCTVSAAGASSGCACPAFFPAQPAVISAAARPNEMNNLFFIVFTVLSMASSYNFCCSRSHFCWYLYANGEIPALLDAIIYGTVQDIHCRSFIQLLSSSIFLCRDGSGRSVLGNTAPAPSLSSTRAVPCGEPAPAQALYARTTYLQGSSHSV